MGLLLTLLWSFNVLAQSPLRQDPGLDILQEVSDHNAAQALIDHNSGALSLRNGDVLPFAEYQKTGYIFFNDDNYRGYATEIKKGIAQNLPADVTLVIYTTSTNKSYQQQVKDEYSQYIDSSRLIVLEVPNSGSNSFWSRDNLPLPVWSDGEFTLVDARYYYNFEPDEFLQSLFSSLFSSHNYFFEGGNFITNSLGECIVVNRRRSYPGGTSDTAAIPDSIFHNQYGCKKLTRLKHLKGIGHADEVVKFLGDDIIVTDTEEYVKTLEELGYQVHLLPEPDRAYETYVNSLQVNDVLFVPSFSESGDQVAVDLFKKLAPNMKIVQLPTRRLATGGQGGIHCITMNYPPVPLQSLRKLLNLQ